MVVLHGPEVAVEPASSRSRGRRPNEPAADRWSVYSSELGLMPRPPTAEQLLSPVDDSEPHSFRMWSPAPPGELRSNSRLSDIEFDTTPLDY